MRALNNDDDEDVDDDYDVSDNTCSSKCSMRANWHALNSNNHLLTQSINCSACKCSTLEQPSIHSTLGKCSTRTTICSLNNRTTVSSRSTRCKQNGKCSTRTTICSQHSTNTKTLNNSNPMRCRLNVRTTAITLGQGYLQMVQGAVCLHKGLSACTSGCTNGCRQTKLAPFKGNKSSE